MKKLQLCFSVFLLTASQSYAAIEVVSPTHPPIITEEFEVTQGDQAKYQKMTKDTDQIKIESGAFGLKQLKQDMQLSEIKARFNNSYQKLIKDSNTSERFPEKPNRNK
jgi:hypothetical protein